MLPQGGSTPGVVQVTPKWPLSQHIRPGPPASEQSVLDVPALGEELNKTFPARIVASEAVIQAVAEEERAGFVGPVVVPIRGHDASLAVRYLPPANLAPSPLLLVRA